LPTIHYAPVENLEHVGVALVDRNDLAETPGIEIRIKHKASAPMHLKSYQIDGRLLRTGAANFSASGLKRQDNDNDRD
jgi:hypothetical protein